MSGDTRLDRVLTIAERAEELPIAEAFRGDGPVLVAGSTWPPDEALLLEALADRPVKCLIAPHELGTEQVARIERTFPKPLACWSELDGTEAPNVRAMLGDLRQGTLLVDRMGLLARLYRYGDVAYVGGGFTDGIHSLLEAAAWGRPVVFGPKHRKFPEAQGLIDAGAGAMVRDVAELRTALRKWLDDPAALQAASAAARAYVQRHAGAAARVAAALRRYW